MSAIESIGVGGWEGVWGALLAAVVSALVAVMVVQLTKRHDRRLWLEQRRVEAFADVLAAWSNCWAVTEHDWNRYSTGLNRSEPPDNDTVQKLRDAELELAEEALGRSVAAWSLYLDRRCAAIESAVDRARHVLAMEWLYRSHGPRGHLRIPMPAVVYDEWAQFLRLARDWHRASPLSRRRAGRKLGKLWRMEPKTHEDILSDFPDSIRFSVD